MRIAHKVVESPVALETHMTGTQQGKFITIYPRSDAEARAIVSALDPLLSGGRLSGPVIPGERSLGSSGLIYTRYGGFTKTTVTHPSGREVSDTFEAPIDRLGTRPVGRRRPADALSAMHQNTSRRTVASEPTMPSVWFVSRSSIDGKAKLITIGNMR